MNAFIKDYFSNYKKYYFIIILLSLICSYIYDLKDYNFRETFYDVDIKHNSSLLSNKDLKKILNSDLGSAIYFGNFQAFEKNIEVKFQIKRGQNFDNFIQTFYDDLKDINIESFKKIYVKKITEQNKFFQIYLNEYLESEIKFDEFSDFITKKNIFSKNFINFDNSKSIYSFKIMNFKVNEYNELNKILDYRIIRENIIKENKLVVFMKFLLIYLSIFLSILIFKNKYVEVIKKKIN